MSNSAPTVGKPSTRLSWRQAHYFSGLLLATFVAIHLTNHLLAGLSPAIHIAFMTATRLVYRHPVVETALLAAVILQISTGLGLVRSVAHPAMTTWRRLHIGSGLYLAFFSDHSRQRDYGWPIRMALRYEPLFWCGWFESLPASTLFHTVLHPGDSILLWSCGGHPSLKNESKPGHDHAFGSSSIYFSRWRHVSVWCALRNDQSLHRAGGSQAVHHFNAFD